MRDSNRARRLRLLVILGLGGGLMAARRSDVSTYGCHRGFLAYGGGNWGTATPFLGAGTSTWGASSFPAGFETPSSQRRLILLSDTSAQTYLFDQDLTDMTQRNGAGVNIPCGVYATQGDAFCTHHCSHHYAQSADFVSLCGVPLGQDLRQAC